MKRSVSKQRAFLKAFAASGSLTEAARAVEMDRGTHYDWLDHDANYVAAFAQARREAADTLQDSAVERALRGVYVPNTFQGHFVYPKEQYEIEPAVPARDWKDPGGEHPGKPAVYGVREIPGAPPLGTWVRSESLHLALLKAWIPAFRANGSLEISGPAGGPISVEQQALKTLTDDELAGLISIAKKLHAAGDGSGTDTPQTA